MKSINSFSSFILDLEALKNKAGRGESRLSNDDKGYILAKKKSELRLKAEQIQEEMQREVDDLFLVMSLKQASLETLSAMYAYVEEESRKIDEQLSSIGRPVKEAKGA